MISDPALLSEISRYMILLGVSFIAASAVMFYRNRLFRYLTIRAEQKGMDVPEIFREKVRNKPVKEKAGVESHERRIPVRKKAIHSIKEDERNEKDILLFGEQDEMGRGETERLEKPRAHTSRPAYGGTTILGKAARRIAKQSDLDEEWIPISFAPKMVKDELVIHAANNTKEPSHHKKRADSDNKD